MKVRNMPRRQQKAVFANMDRPYGSGKITERQRAAILEKNFGKGIDERPPEGTRARAEWNSFNYAITTTRQYRKYRDKGHSPRLARDEAMKELGMTPETRKGNYWFSIENLPPRQQVVARRYYQKIA